MSHDIQWIHKGSSCILLRSSISKVSCLKIHNDLKEISSSFVTKEKIIFNRRPKKKPFPSDQVKQQVKYQCWHVNKHTRPWGSLFIFPWGIYEAAAFLIPVSCVTVWTIIHLFMTWLTAPNLADNSGAQRDRELGSQISHNWFSDSLFRKFLQDTSRVSVHKGAWST